MITEKYCRQSRAFMRVLRSMMLCITGIATIATMAHAQQRYSYLPTASTTDGRFFSIAGAGISTLGDNTVTFKITSPGAAANVEIGIFDGETGGMWDQGTVPLQYTLYADPNGDASGSVQVGQWSGASMSDNAWSNITVNNIAGARSAGGDYFYILRITSTNAAAFSWSSFKIRTNGTLAGLRNTSFAYTAPLAGQADASVVYPSWPAMTPTNYDGGWSFFLDVRAPLTSLTLWDGDMDRGNYDCTDNDTDDPDTPNGVLPSFASGSAAGVEGVAIGGTACTDAEGNTLPGLTTSNPPDNSRLAALRRGQSVSYQIITPSGEQFVNTNPSGNLEWEQFRLDMAPFNRNTMDYHIDSIPVGIYRLQIAGVDMSNLNAWRFPVDFLGVDTNGTPILPPPPDVNDGVIEGTIFVDANNNTTQDIGEPGFPGIDLKLLADYNNDGVVDATTNLTTDINGKYRFSNLRGGKYTVKVDTNDLPDGFIPTGDADGLTTPNSATVTITATQKNRTANFSYMPICAPGTATRGYWRNHPSAWPVQNLVLGSRVYTKTEALAILAHSTAGDKTYSLAAQLIATKLNLLQGNKSSCIGSYVVAADAWLARNAVGHGCTGSSWTSISATHEKLDDYNNGDLCVPHRDEVDCNVQNTPPPPAPGSGNTCKYRGRDDDDDDSHGRHCRSHRGNDDDDDDDNDCHGRVH